MAAAAENPAPAGSSAQAGGLTSVSSWKVQGKNIEGHISVLGVGVERDVRLREEEVARETTPFEAVQHRGADRIHPAPTRRLVEAIGQQPAIDQTVGGDVVKVGKQVLTDH